jgi:hypothetical protein
MNLDSKYRGVIDSFVNIDSTEVIVWLVCCAIWAKFGISELRVHLLKISEFRVNRGTKHRTFLVGVNMTLTRTP